MDICYTGCCIAVCTNDAFDLHVCVLVNGRLNESNVQSISTQVEQMYTENSRNGVTLICI